MTISIEFHIHIHYDGQQGQVSKAGNDKSRNAGNNGDFFRLAEQQIEALSRLRSLSTIDNYRTALRSFARYHGGSLPQSGFTVELLQGYERWLTERGVGKNTSSCYMRSLRALAVRVWGDEALSIFNKVYTGRCTTEKRAIRQEELRRIRALKLQKGSFLSLVRDLFLFSFYALGMPFVDMAFLRRTQIADGQLTYCRHKTGQHITVNIEPCMQQIINSYASPDSDYVFPLLTAADPRQAYREYQSVLHRYNRTLKQLGRAAGISRRLTSYMSRHTWASMAYSSNIGLPAISKGLGHASPQHTLVYIQQIGDQQLHQANRQMLRKTLAIRG